MLRPPESVENKNDHDLPFNIAGLMQSLAERGAKWLRPTHRCVANHRYRALPRPGYGAGQYQEARGGPRRPVDGGHVAAGDPDGFGTGEEFVRRPLDGSPGAKIKFKLGGTLQIFNPNLWRVR